MVKEMNVDRVIIEKWDKVLKDRRLNHGDDRHYTNDYIRALHSAWAKYKVHCERRLAKLKTDAKRAVWQKQKDLAWDQRSKLFTILITF